METNPVEVHLQESKVAFNEADERAALLQQIRDLNRKLEIASKGGKQSLDKLSGEDYAKARQAQERKKAAQNVWKDCPKCGLVYYRPRCDC